jgi:Nucleoside 2-deoxyribosyltransferase
MQYRWVPLFGHFSETKRGLVFHGRWEEFRPPNLKAPERLPSFGLTLSDQQISDGSISAEVSFAAVGETTGCEFVLAFDFESRSYLTAGISGYSDCMFSVREWSNRLEEGGAQARWTTHSAGGDRRNLVPGREYSLRAALFGSRVELSIDGVLLTVVSVPFSPRYRRVLGLWCRSHDEIRISKVKMDVESPVAFMVMQFTQQFDEVYSGVVRDVCKDFGLEPLRADEVYNSGLIIADVVEQIQRAQVVIADITPVNANVYFEVGYALALGKPMILLARKGTDLPFDVRAFRVLFYEDSIAGKTKLQEGLERHLSSLLGSKPVTND